MKILFLTMTRFSDGSEHGIYTDLMRKFRDEGHDVYVVFPVERRFHKATNLQNTNGMHILGVRTLNVQKTNVIEWAKRNNPKAVTYLQLKDIFPQNAVDLGMMSKTGAKGVLYRRFRKKEERLYEISDWIGCMSPANVKYVLDNNQWISAEKVEICPNSYEIPEQAVILSDGEEAYYCLY